jgi:hypothetical protein
VWRTSQTISWGYKGEEAERPKLFRHFLVDYGYPAGESFCRALLDAGEFAPAMLGRFCQAGFKNMPKQQVASHVASRLVNGEINADDLMLAFCQQPRDWLCLRLGNKVNLWPQKGTAIQFLTQRESHKGFVWYGPFGTGDERWYVVAKNIEQVVNLGDEWGKRNMRWHVMVQMTPGYVALHWFNASVHEKPEQKNHPQFAFWHHTNDIYTELNSIIRGNWDPEEPNLARLILHEAMERYEDHPQYKWDHKAVRSIFDSVALSASGSGTKMITGSNKEERAASGLQILTEELASTVAEALGIKDEALVRKGERALLRKILRGQGTKSYEFTLDERQSGNPIARMRVSFGVDTAHAGRQTQDTIQHVHCFAKYGRSTGALKFILSELGLGNSDEPEEEPDQDEDPYWDD